MMEPLEYHDFLDKDIAIKAAYNFRILRKNGVTIRKTIDVIIATLCIENDYELIHNDKNYNLMEEILGLKKINLRWGIMPRRKKMNVNKNKI